MALDTQVPPWLVQALGPRPPESPWILQAMQQGMQREEMKRKLPLELQGMAIQNQARGLAAEHQGMANQALSKDLEAQQEDLPVYSQWFEQYSQNPVAMVDAPAPLLKSQKYQEMVLNAKKTAAQTTWAKTYQEQQIAAAMLAAKLNLEGVDTTSAFIEGKFGPSGPNQWDTAQLAKLQEQVIARRQAATLEQIQARNEWRYDPITGELIARSGGNAEVKLVEFEGAKFLQNTKTGALHQINKNVSKKEFIATHVSSWMRDNLWTVEEATKALNEFYDKNLAPSVGNETTSAPAPAAQGQQGAQLKPGSVVRQGGKTFRYKGGPVSDPASYEEVK